MRAMSAENVGIPDADYTLQAVYVYQTSITQTLRDSVRTEVLRNRRKGISRPRRNSLRFTDVKKKRSRNKKRVTHFSVEFRPTETSELWGRRRVCRPSLHLHWTLWNKKKWQLVGFCCSKKDTTNHVYTSSRVNLSSVLIVQTTQWSDGSTRTGSFKPKPNRLRLQSRFYMFTVTPQDLYVI